MSEVTKKKKAAKKQDVSSREIREKKLLKAAGNITHFSKLDLVKLFLSPLTEKDLDEFLRTSEKVRSSKTKNRENKVMVKEAS